MQVIIDKFGETPEPEFPGHVILEQYQAQVGAALRPAFAPDTPSDVTAAACNVCSAWIGSGVARDLGDLRRVYQLLVSSLEKLRPKQNSQQLYNESALTLEKLSILKAWAEVYSVSMKNEISAFHASPSTSSLSDAVNKQSDEEDDFGDFEGTSSEKSESKSNLATLVQSELPSLSKHWLSALKDHSLLTLPSDFKSQLPHDGGAFYTNDTIESARPHYRATWPPILEAAAIWLTYGGGFDNEKESINKDRFFLLFGICMEALANSRSADMTREEVTSCLKTLKALLDHPWCRRDVLAAEEPIFLVELCNVLHRTVLTRDHAAMQVLAMEVLKFVLMAAKENLEVVRKQKRKEMEIPANREDSPELDLLGEGGEDGKIEIGKSVVFATLEVCLCVLVRHYPELSHRASSLKSVVAMQAKSRLKGRHFTEEQGHLIAMALTSLSSIPDLCSPLGALSILPSVLWLITGVLKEAAWKSDSNPSASDPQISTSLQCLKTIASCNYATDDRCSQRWSELLQSSLLRFLDAAKTSPDSESDLKIDEVTLLLTVTVFLLHCPPSVICSPDIQYPAMNAFTRCFQSTSPLIRHRCLQTLQSIFQHPDRRVALPYIQSLSPRIMHFLLDDASREVKTEEEFRVTTECVVTVEILLRLLEDDQKQGIMLQYLIPILVGQLLQHENMKEATKFKLSLHETALTKLIAFGQSHPEEFKNALSQSPDLKSRLEAALLANRARIEQQQQEKEASNALQLKKVKQEHKPSIKLSMDFSNFAAKAAAPAPTTGNTNA